MQPHAVELPLYHCQYFAAIIWEVSDNYVLILSPGFSVDTVTKKKVLLWSSSSPLLFPQREKKHKTIHYLGHLRFGVTYKERHVVDFILYHKVLLFSFEILEIHRTQLKALIIHENSI